MKKGPRISEEHPGALHPIITGDRIAERVAELATRIRSDYEGKDFTIVAVMKGAIFFLVDLLRRIDLPARLDVVHVSSYAGAESSGAVEVLSGITLDIRNRDVLIVDDILDTGLTLRRVIDEVNDRNPRSLKTCVLLSKRRRREVEIQPDYCGFEIADRYVVGYGLDHNDRYRHLPYVAAAE